MTNLCDSLGKMSLQFKKPQKKNLRQRLDEDGEPEESMEVDDNSALCGIKRDKKKKKKEKSEAEKQKPKTTTLLSFGEDLHDADDGEVFQVKKSSQSKKLMRQMDKERKKRKEQEKLAVSASNGNNSAVPVVVVKQERASPPLVIEVKKEKPVILNGREAEFAQERSDSDSGEEDGVPRFSRPKQLQRVLESGCIPDAAMIHAARKSRQRAREMGGDFIPIEDKSTDNSSSRLVRDEDHDVSDEDGDGEGLRENQRLDFTVDTAAKEQERRREAFFAAQDEEGEEKPESDQEDDELEDWEAQQIRKAFTGSQLVAAQQEVLQYQAVSSGNIRNRVTLGKHILTLGAPSSSSNTPAIVPKQEPAVEQVLAQMPVKTEAPTIDELTRLLRDRLSSLKETQRRHVLDREKAQAELAELATERQDLADSEPERSQRFQFYQDLRGYVTDLVECFDEKMGILETLEQRAVTLLAKKTSMLVQRRRQDVKDQAAEAAAFTRPAGALLEQDEARVRRAAEREGRRSRRRRARELKISKMDPLIPPPRHFEGYSSDDEQSELERSSLMSQIEQIDRDAQLVMNDVVDEFSKLQHVLRKFEEWKKFDFNSYKEAYVHLALPKLLAPLIRLQLTTWNPLEENCRPIESYSWFQNAALYGLSISETEEQLKSDPDVNLIPLVIELGILPKLTKIVVEAWDPCSSTQTQRLCTILRHILTEYPQLAARGRVSKSLLPAVSEKLKDAIDNDVFIPIYPARPAAALGLFFQRQFWSATKLLRNVLSFRAILSDSVLQEMSMAALLGRYLLAALRTCEPLDALEKSRHLLAAIPKAWLHKEPQMIQLQMFSTQVTNIVKAIDVTIPGGRDALIEALAILKTLGAKSKAEELGKIYL